MKLEEFVGKKINISQLARELGYHRVHLSKVFLGERPVSKQLADALEKATNGQLKAEELLKNNKESKN